MAEVSAESADVLSRTDGASTRRAGSPRRRDDHAFADLIEAGVRVVRRSRLPSRRGVLAFFGNQVLVNGVAWTAGLMAAGLVTRFFEVRGIRNLWGLTSWGRRTVVSADDYVMITGLTAYSAGLVMLLLARHLILRLLAEFQQLRLERVRCGRASDSGTGGPAIWLPRSIDGPELDLDD